MPKVPCARCKVNLVDYGYCAACEPRSPKALADQHRGSSTERGYDARWQRFRLWFLHRHPLCEDCGRLAVDVHHKLKVKDHPEFRLVESNCMALCKPCHTVRTDRGE